KNLIIASDLISSLLDAFLSSSEEPIFGEFLEDLAVYIASTTCNGHKSSASGVDLEFFNKATYYIVSIKSGSNWGNSSQQKKLEQDLQNAMVRMKQSKKTGNVQTVLGICYGKTKTVYKRGYLKVVGQNFWYLISENPELYTDIIEPIGYHAKEHNDNYLKEKARVINKFTKDFMDTFCNSHGDIEWNKLIEFNSKNLDLDNFIS
ncbi:MAG: PmeII family type II restriction endonuclease, partial [Chloroflexota bacterium]